MDRPNSSLGYFSFRIIKKVKTTVGNLTVRSLVAVILMSLVFFTGCTSVSDPNMSVQHSVSPSPSPSSPGTNDIAQSKEMLLQVIGHNNNITFKETQETDLGTYNKFSTVNGTIYYVNSITGNIDRVENQNLKFTTDVKLNLREAEVAAQTYVDKFSITQDRPGLAIVKSRLLDHGFYKEYSVEFRETVDGVLVPNLAVVSIDPSNGELMSYISINQEVDIPLKPQLSKEEALKIATGQFPGIIVRSQDTVLEVGNLPDKGQKLIWVITLKGEPVNMVLYGGTVAIDAMDGTVLFKDVFL